MIVLRIHLFSEQLAKTDHAKISKYTKANSKIDKYFLTKKKYDLIDHRMANFLINRFWTVGFADPFPDDDENIVGSVDDIPADFKSPCHVEHHVYPDSRYMPN